MEAIRPDTPPLEAEPYGLTRMGEALASGFRTRGHSRQSAGSIEKRQPREAREGSQNLGAGEARKMYAALNLCATPPACLACASFAGLEACRRL